MSFISLHLLLGVSKEAIEGYPYASWKLLLKLTSYASLK